METDNTKDKVLLKKKWFITSRKGRIEDFYDFNVRNLLGSGSYGDVVKGTIKNGKIHRAIKVIKKSKVRNPERFQAEINIMRELDHPNVLKLFEFFEDNRYIYLVMELCDGGELFDKIVDKGSFNEGLARYYFKQIMSALNYIHSKNICHRDLKPENFLLLSKADNSPLKIIDFGLSVLFDEKQLKESKGKMTMTTKAGTPYYISPEILKGKYDLSCDIWSSGVILYILLSGVPPFYGSTDNEIIDKVRKGKYDLNIPELQGVSENSKRLIRSMICEPKKRLKASEVLLHKWMTVDDPAYETNLNINIRTLKQFQQANKFKKTVLSYMATQLNETEIQQLGTTFSKLDVNNDGVIEIEEIKNGLNKLNKQDSNEIVDMFQQMDSDGSGKIDYTEFIAATLERSIYQQEDKLFQAFKHFDKDQSGRISCDELKEALGSAEEYKSHDNDKWASLIRQADRNGDGEIDYNEFIEMMKN